MLQHQTCSTYKKILEREKSTTLSLDVSVCHTCTHVQNAMHICTYIATRVHMVSQDIRYSCWYVCQSDLVRSLLITTRQKRWTVPLRNGCWQCRKGYLFGVRDTMPSWLSWRSCESVDWNPYSSIKYCTAMRLYNSLANSDSYTMKKQDLTCLYAAEYTIQWSLVSPYPFCHGWSDAIVYLLRKAAKVWTHWSQPFCHRPQGETRGVLDILFWWNSSERTQQQTLYSSPMVCSSYQ